MQLLILSTWQIEIVAEKMMNFNKTCTCGVELTTKNTKKMGRTLNGLQKVLWLNCRACNTTIIFKLKVDQKADELFAKINNYFNSNYTELKKEHNSRLADSARHSNYYDDMKFIAKMKF